MTKTNVCLSSNKFTTDILSPISITDTMVKESSNKVNLENKDSKLLKVLSTSLNNNNIFYDKNTSINGNSIENIAVMIIDSFFDNNKATVNNDIQVLISDPLFSNSVNKVDVNLFYFGQGLNISRGWNKSNFVMNDSENMLDNKKLLSLVDALSMLFEKEVNLNLTRVHYPYINSKILAKYLVSNAGTNTFLQFSESILSYPSVSPSIYVSKDQDMYYALPSYITDIRLELKGRLITEQVIPRVTKKSNRISNQNVNSGSVLSEGGIASSSMQNTVVDYSKYNSKNELGTFTLKVWITTIHCVDELLQFTTSYYKSLQFTTSYYKSL
nr:ribosomal protein S3 [Malassezia sp.]